MGVPLQTRSDDRRRTYERTVAEQCRETPCNPQDLPQSLLSQSEAEGALAITAIATGGLLIAIGLTWALLNQPVPVMPANEARTTSRLVPIASEYLGLRYHRSF